MKSEIAVLATLSLACLGYSSELDRRERVIERATTRYETSFESRRAPAIRQGLNANVFKVFFGRVMVSLPRENKISTLKREVKLDAVDAIAGKSSS